MLKHKNEVLSCFQDFHKLVANQFNARVRVLRTDNGTEYMNNEFRSYLSDQRIIHQTTCPGTPPQNGVAEKESSFIGGSKVSHVSDECTQVFVERGSDDNHISYQSNAIKNT